MKETYFYCCFLKEDYTCQLLNKRDFIITHLSSSLLYLFYEIRDNLIEIFTMIYRYIVCICFQLWDFTGMQQRGVFNIINIKHYCQYFLVLYCHQRPFCNCILVFCSSWILHYLKISKLISGFICLFISGIFET